MLPVKFLDADVDVQYISTLNYFFTLPQYIICVLFELGATDRTYASFHPRSGGVAKTLPAYERIREL